MKRSQMAKVKWQMVLRFHKWQIANPLLFAICDLPFEIVLPAYCLLLQGSSQTTLSAQNTGPSVQTL